MFAASASEHRALSSPPASMHTAKGYPAFANLSALGKPSLDRPAIRRLEPPRKGSWLTSRNGDAVDANDRQHFDRCAHEHHLFAGAQFGEGHLGFAEGNRPVLSEPEDEPARRSGQDSGTFRRAFKPASAHPEHR